MAHPNTLASLSVKGAISQPIIDSPLSLSAGYAVVLNTQGEIDSSFASGLEKSKTLYADNRIARLNLIIGYVRKGDIVKQLDNNIAYRLVNEANVANDSGWEAMSPYGITQAATGAITIAASGTNQDITIVPSGTGAVIVPSALLANTLSGNGGGLSGLQASQIEGAGQLPDTVLSANIPRKNTSNIFAQSVTFQSGIVISGGSISGDGSSITNINATNISSGAIHVVRGGTGLVSYTAGNYINALNSTTLQQRTPVEVRNDIGANNADNLSAGTLASERLPQATTSVLGAVRLTANVADVTNSVTTIAATPKLIKDYTVADSAITFAAGSIGKLVRTDGTGKIDPSLINGAVIGTLKGAVFDTSGYIENLNLEDSGNQSAITLSATDATISTKNAGVGTLKCTLQFPQVTMTNKVITLPDNTGIVNVHTSIKVVPESGAASGISESKFPVYTETGDLIGYVPIYPN